MDTLVLCSLSTLAQHPGMMEGMLMELLLQVSPSIPGGLGQISKGPVFPFYPSLLGLVKEKKGRWQIFTLNL